YPARHHLPGAARGRRRPDLHSGGQRRGLDRRGARHLPGLRIDDGRPARRRRRPGRAAPGAGGVAEETGPAPGGEAGRLPGAGRGGAVMTELLVCLLVAESREPPRPSLRRLTPADVVPRSVLMPPGVRVRRTTVRRNDAGSLEVVLEVEAYEVRPPPLFPKP